MKEKIKTFLIAYCQSKGWSTSDKDLEEVLVEQMPVFKEIGSAHRWYDDEFRVVEIDGRFIGFNWYHVTGDNSISDMDLELDTSSVCFVDKKQKMVDYYEPEEL